LPAEFANLWDDTDGFYYDVLRLPSGSFQPLKVRSLQGVMPIFAVETIAISDIERQEGQDINARLKWFISKHPELMLEVSPGKVGAGEIPSDEEIPVEAVLQESTGGFLLFSLVNKEKLRRLLQYLLDEKEFLSPHGIRSVSQYHRDHPVQLQLEGTTYTLSYAPAESITQSFGGNSNWRGPVWFPINFLLIESLQKYHQYYGNDFKVECPTGSGNFVTLWEVSQELSRRLVSLFTRRTDGTRPVYGGTQMFQQNPDWKDYILFFEYFHGDNGAGLGASHQTGWTGLVAKLIQQTTEYENKVPG
jgi:Glycosyl hydrolase family 63 C-terminal domain